MWWFEDIPQQVYTSWEQLSQLKDEYECVQSERVVSAIWDVWRIIIENQKAEPLTQDNILSVINKWNNMYFHALRKVWCNFPNPPEYLNMSEVDEDVFSKATDLYFQSQWYTFGYADYVIDEKYIMAPTLRKVEEEQMRNLSDFFQEWEKYWIVIESLDIPIIFFGFDETWLSTDLNLQQGVIWQWGYSEWKVEIFRWDTRNFEKYFNPNFSETQLRRREHNIVADEMWHALFNNALGLQDEIISNKTFLFREQEYTTFQLNEFCSMLSSLRFGVDKLDNINFLLWVSSETSEFQYDLGKTLFNELFWERQQILGLSDIYEYIDYCSTLSEDDLDSEVEIVLQKAEHIFFYELLPLLKW